MRTNIPTIILLALMFLVTGCEAQNDNAAVSASVSETIETDNAQPNEETTEIGFTEDNLPELYERRKFVGSAVSFTITHIWAMQLGEHILFQITRRYIDSLIMMISTVNLLTLGFL